MQPNDLYLQGSSKDSATFSNAKHQISRSSCLQVGHRLWTLVLHAEQSVCPLWHCNENESDIQHKPNLEYLKKKSSWTLTVLIKIQYIKWSSKPYFHLIKTKNFVWENVSNFRKTIPKILNQFEVGTKYSTHRQYPSTKGWLLMLKWRVRATKTKINKRGRKSHHESRKKWRAIQLYVTRKLSHL